MQRDVARQAVDTFDQVEELVQVGAAQTGGAQLGQLLDRLAGVAGADVREGGGDGVDLAGRHAERGPDVTDRVADPVGVHHRHARHPVGAEPREDRVVDLHAAVGLHVDVDVGQRRPQRGQEPLHEQAVPDRVDPADAEHVADQAARARPAGGDPDAEAAGQVAHLGDGEEVPGEAELVDDGELVVQAGLDRRGSDRADG